MAAGISGIILIGLLIASKKSAPIAEKIAELRLEHSREALFLAGFVALFGMMASLYLSEIAHFLPCKLCLYQRIVMLSLIHI